MNEQILKICPTLGEYLKSRKGWPLNYENNKKFYKDNVGVIDMELIIYGEINGNRKKLGGDKKIHKI